MTVENIKPGKRTAADTRKRAVLSFDSVSFGQRVVTKDFSTVGAFERIPDPTSSVAICVRAGVVQIPLFLTDK